MKCRSRSLLGAFAMLALVSTINSQLSTTLAQGTAFTYQGQLQNNGGLANGTYNLQFSLFNVASGGGAVAGPVTTNGVIVSNGLFTVTIDFGGAVWNGDTNWLQIGVETNGGGSFTVLSPRQEVTPTPYAIYAEGADAAGLSGTIPMASFSGTYGGVVNLNNAGDSFTGNGAGLTGVNALTLDGLGPNNFWQLTGNAGTTPGVNFAGTKDKTPFYLDVNSAPVLVLNTNNSIVMANGTLGPSTYNYEVALGQAAKATANGSVAIGWNPTSSGPGSVAIGESVVSSANDSFASGGYSQATAPDATAMGYSTVASGIYSMAAGYNAQALNTGSFVWADNSSGAPFASTSANEFLVRAQFVGINRTNSLDGNDYFTVRANVTNTWGGINMETAGAGLPWYGYSESGAIYAYTYLDGTTDNSWYLYNDGAQLTFSVNGNFGLDNYDENDGFINNGATTGAGLTFGSSSGEGIASKRTSGGNQYGLDFYTDFTDRMSISQSGVAQFNNDLYLQAADGTGDAGLGWRTSVAGVSVGPGGGGCFLWGYDGGALGTTSPNAVNLTWDYSGNVWVSNNCSVASLTIRGGADLAEPFHISNMSRQQQEIPRGSVVVIDEKNPGQLKISDRPYDTRVAGVLSGANGINPGIQMQQQGLMEGDQNVALSGRVYVLADSANGTIQPGDLLTTSATPGYAMKVTNHSKAEGAILGKAMTSLTKGKGMVLVLVTLQ